MLSEKLRAATAAAAAGLTEYQRVFIGGTGSTQTEYTWTVPEGVTSICAVAIGSGGAGDTNDSSAEGHRAGDLRWRNNISVTPGETLNVRPANGPVTDNDSGSPSYLFRITPDDILTAAGGSGQTGTNGTSTLIGGDVGGGNGGEGGTHTSTNSGGGGGTGGYSGNGGSGASSGSFSSPASGSGAAYGGINTTSRGQRGGGVNLIGIGTTGVSENFYEQGGSWGSGGTNSDPTTANNNGMYGGGGAGNDSASGTPAGGAPGAIRIICGDDRAFPSDAADYLPIPSGSFTEIEIRVQLPRKSTGIYDTSLSFIKIYDETGTNYFNTLTSAGGTTTAFSQLSPGYFGCSWNYVATALDVLKQADNYTGSFLMRDDKGSPASMDYVLSFFIKLATAKRISRVDFGSNYGAQTFFPYIDVIADGENITLGDAVMVPTFNVSGNNDYSLWTVQFT